MNQNYDEESVKNMSLVVIMENVKRRRGEEEKRRRGEGEKGRSLKVFYNFDLMDEYYRVKDRCRQGLIKYLSEAVSFIPEEGYRKMLDIGCGTGVPTIFVAEKLNGSITAIDTDKNALEWLGRKIINKNLQGRISVINISFFDLKSDSDTFNLALAEGFLNVVGFKEGFQQVVRILKQGGYFIIHDENRDHEEKCRLIAINGCELAGSIFLDEKVWWNDYYSQLEAEINSLQDNQYREMFRSELQEIAYYKLDPSPFRSVYYIVRKQCLIKTNYS
jgi:ubiquinone/menaquinone biosynthesis C-methylase UbiE